MPRSLQSTLSQHLMPHLPQSTMTLRTSSASSSSSVSASTLTSGQASQVRLTAGGTLGTSTTSCPPYSNTCPLQPSMFLTVVHAPYSHPCPCPSLQQTCTLC